VLATVAPGLVMAIAIFMILQELQIAEGIVIITYAALVGSLALAAALAFGLGGRDVAARMLEAAYQKGQESREQVRRDFAQGRERAREDVERAKDKAQEIEGDSLSGPPSRRGREEVGATTGAGTMSSTGSMTGAGATGGDVTVVDRAPGSRADLYEDVDDVPPPSGRGTSR
jgi:hypothetical protein